MSLLTYLKSLFGAPALPAASIYHQDAEAFRVRHTAYLAEKAAKLPLKLKRLEPHYEDFNAFFYRPDFDIFVKNEFLPAWQPDNQHIQFLDDNHWQRKHPFNFPGPFYTGESDTCGTGICEAPTNVACDQYSCEYVFRQPHSHGELVQLLHAAAVEVCESYSANGNDHWTYTGCRNWWQNRHEVLATLTQPNVTQSNNGQAQAYVAYLAGEAEMDLRRYCYFLENGVYPPAQEVLLPAL